MQVTSSTKNLLIMLIVTAWARHRANDVSSLLLSNPGPINQKYAKTITLVVDTAFDLPASHMTIVYDHRKEEFITYLCMTLHHIGIKTSLYRLEREDESTNYLDEFLKDAKDRAGAYLEACYLFMTSTATSEDIMSMIHLEKLGRRNVIYIFLWREKEVSDVFRGNIDEVARVSIIRKSGHHWYRVYYNQATPDGNNILTMVNWWSWEKGFFQNPLLPHSSQVFRNMKNRTFIIPVLHKPPWYFVSFTNDSLLVEGGRDDKLLTIISEKMNFRFEYFDPPDRSEGSAMVNNTMQGVLGLIWQGEVDIFIGDTTVTFERSLVVEFSFFTLSDSEIFLTHAPGKLNEALALIRPFQWEVWPAIIGTIALSGPLLFVLRKERIKWGFSSMQELCDCVWITTTIFLRQSLVTKIHGDRARLAVILLYLIATYVIGDMYSANLTSLFTRPAREKPISTLEQLNDAMANKDFELLVERHSASHGIFENGTGIYGSIWNKMKTQHQYLLDSTEEGIELVKDHKNIALIGGRETFFYNSKRFGVQHFHLSEKLYTRYSAIALQIGCPFVDQLNQLIINMFETGILNKITEDEYQKLREKQTPTTQKIIQGQSETTKEVGEGKVQSEDDETLKAMSMQTLQGAFYVLLAGCFLGGVVLLCELAVDRQKSTGVDRLFFVHQRMKK